MDTDKWIDSIFGKAKKEASVILYSKLGRGKYEMADLKRIDVVTDQLNSRIKTLISISKPDLSKFQRKLLETLIDFEKVKEERYKLGKTAKILKQLHLEYEVKIKFADNRRKSNKFRQAFYGRVVSLLKKLKAPETEKIHHALRQLPTLKDIDTVLLIGFPNVGKSSILKTLCGTDVEIKSYPFTTKGISVGYFKNRYSDVQVIDTPGLLDRPFEEMNEIEQRALVVLKNLSKNIVFVADPTETCGYSIEKQKNLLETVKKKFSENIILVATKKDISETEFEADLHVNSNSEEDVGLLRRQIISKFFK